MIKRSNLLRYGAFLVLLGVFDFLTSQSIPTFNGSVPNLDDGHRQLLTDISSHRGYGTHYVTIMVGNPPQLLRLAVATGSDYTSFPCQGCYTCREPHFQYTAGTEHQCPSECLYAESTCRDDQSGCHLTITYSGTEDLNSEGYKGFEVTDYAYVDTSKEVVNYHSDIAKAEGFPLHFICQEESLGGALLSDGYLGMSTAPLSFVNQLHKAKKINQPIFSLCFRQFDSYQPVGESAGHMTLGHVDRDLLDSPLVWAANKASPNSLSSYAIHIRRIYLGKGGKSNILSAAATGTMSIMPIGGEDDAINVDYSKINGELGHVLIQTNQPTSSLDSSVEEAFVSAFYSITGIHYISPYFKMTEEEYQLLPTIFIQIEAHHGDQDGHLINQHIPGLAGKLDPEHPYDILLAVPPEHYIIFLNELAFPTLRFGSESKIASNLLQHHELVFDLHHDRIGLAERRHCPQGMSMMTPLVPASHAQSGAQARSIGEQNFPLGENSEGHHVAGVVAGEAAKNGTVLVPEDRDFIVAASDLDIEQQSDNDGSKKNPSGRTASQARAVNVSPAISAERDDEDSGNTNGRSPSPASSGNGNAINAELDDSDRNGGGQQGRTAGGQPVRAGSHGGNAPDNGSSRAPDGPLVELQNGLPKARISTSTQAVRIGPGAISSEQALGDALPKTQRTRSHDFFNLIGFALFFLGFCFTLTFTEDSTAFYAYITNNDPTDEPDGPSQAWKRGLSFYRSGRQIRVIENKRRNLKNNIDPRRRLDDSVGHSGFSQRKQDWVDDYTYMGDSYYEDGRSHHHMDDRSYYARDDRSYYTRDDKTEVSFDGRSYYTERPYYDSRKPASQTDESSGSYYQPYVEYEEKMSDSKSDRFRPSISQRPYYDVSSRSARSMYSQKSFRSSKSDSDESAFDLAYKPSRAHFDAYDQSAVFNHSMNSFASEESNYVPHKKADIRKFIKPVNADDRYVFTSSTGSKSASRSCTSFQRGDTTKTDFAGNTNYYSQNDTGRHSHFTEEVTARSGADGIYYISDQYGDSIPSQGRPGPYAVRARADLQRGVSAEYRGADDTFYSSPYDRYMSRSDLDYHGPQSGSAFGSEMDFHESPGDLGTSRGSHGGSGASGHGLTSQDPRHSSFQSLESSTRDGTIENTEESDHRQLLHTVLPPPTPHHPTTYQDPDDYSDVASFYVDEVSLAKFKGVRK